MGVAIVYQVSLPNPANHLFEVELQIQDWSLDTLDLKLPVWTPGSYVVREYSRHLQAVQAHGREGDRLVCQKLSKNHWQVNTAGVTSLTVSYQVLATELTVRTNHLDTSHGYFNPAALLLYVPQAQYQPLKVKIVPPKPGWHVATPLPSVPGEANTFLAADYDTLVDSPFEIGPHQHYAFAVQGIPHEFVIWGEGNLKPSKVLQDTQRVVETEAALFGGLPYDRYLFLLHLVPQGYGGLEHKNACSLIYSRLGFSEPESYQRFVQLVAHEFFHLWNIKRIRPKALETFDYEGENYTPSLWFSEGTTSYYDLLIPFRAGIYNAQTFLDAVSKDITRLQTTPGREVQPLAESSFDAWIKLYRRDAYSDNHQISYYLKGELVSFLLDLLIRDRHDNQRSLDDVMRQMWQQFGKDEIGFTPEALQTVFETVVDQPLGSFFQTYLETTKELPFDHFLQPFGLHLELTEGDTPWFGATVIPESDRAVVKFVTAGSPAEQAGLDIGDELLALNGLKLTGRDLQRRLQDFGPGEAIAVTFFHQDVLQTAEVTLATPIVTQYQIRGIASPSEAQIAKCKGWLGIAPGEVV